jgi:NAD(P) transhydrogenase
MSESNYDLVVIGSGPSGHRAAIAAAKLGKRVLIVEKMRHVGGVSVSKGTIPSKTMREAVLYLSGVRAHAFYGESYRVKDEITAEDLLSRTHAVITREWEVLRNQLARNRVKLLQGTGSFVDPHTLAVATDAGIEQVRGDFIVIAVGTRPATPAGVEVDGRTIHNSDTILELDRIPRTMTCIGGGVIGLEYACIFAALGTRVTVVDQAPSLLSFVDREIVDSLIYQMRELNVVFRLGEKVERAVLEEKNGMKTALVFLQSEKIIATELALYSAGRQGNTDGLQLDNAGLAADERGRIKVDADCRTSVPHIYACGDVIGFPALASTSMEQGRHAALHAFGIEKIEMVDLYPYGIYTIPEISMVGATEERLTQNSVPYEIGIARYREIARGQILGDESGLLKLLVHRDNRKLMGVHAIGTGSTELIHIGQAVIGLGGTIDYLINAVFNYPTLAECYKTAALNASNRIAAVETS